MWMTQRTVNRFWSATVPLVTRTGTKASPLRSKLRLAFPAYSQMRRIPYIRFLDGHPWLTPYAWCYRLIYNTRHRKDFMVRTARGLDSDDAYAAAKEELEFFKEMGLL